ncbi:MAG: methyltransferase domain-containing protein [Candidatus Eiseniibacteriota bacterium]|jgi:SAM-dependent methyltransferase
MDSPVPAPIQLDQGQLRREIQKEYREVALDPDRGFHFHTGRRLASIVGYQEAWLDAVPETVVRSFAGTGNPFSIRPLHVGERVVDLGCGAGIDSYIAAGMVGERGAVIGIDMTDEMLERAEQGKASGSWPQLEFKQGVLEELPIEDGWADVVISNGVVNLCPDKGRVFAEIARVLKPGGRIQIGDILVARPVSETAKQDIALWTG